jgi:cytochrome bd-type quinol oxidase subunit 2
MSVGLGRFLVSIALWIAVMALRFATAPLHLSRRLEDSVFVVAFLAVPLVGAVLTIKAALKESREGRYKGQAFVATLGALAFAVVGLFAGTLIWLRLAAHASGMD